MNLKTLQQKYKKLTKTIDDTFKLKKDEVEELVDKNSDLDDKIKKLEKESEKKKEEEKAKRDEKQQKQKEDLEKKKLEVKNKINSKKKRTKVEVDEEDENDDVESKVSTKSASREITQLFNAMIQRKELVNRVRSVDVELKKDGRNSIMVVDGFQFMLLNIDGDGKLILRTSKTDNVRKVFRFIIIPLLSVLNDYFSGSISISNKKDTSKSISFNSEKTFYVSSNQIKNKPVKPGQIIRFTNLKHGKFNIK